MIEENLPVLEAIQEARSVRAYFSSEADVNSFVQEATKLKLQQKASLGLDDVDQQSSELLRENHPVIPSAKQVSAIYLQASNQLLGNGVVEYPVYPMLT